MIYDGALAADGLLIQDRLDLGCLVIGALIILWIVIGTYQSWASSIPIAMTALFHSVTGICLK